VLLSYLRARETCGESLATGVGTLGLGKPARDAGDLDDGGQCCPDPDDAGRTVVSEAQKGAELPPKVCGQPSAFGPRRTRP
jgi:hypothetical protein